MKMPHGKTTGSKIIKQLVRFCRQLKKSTTACMSKNAPNWKGSDKRPLLNKNGFVWKKKKNELKRNGSPTLKSKSSLSFRKLKLKGIAFKNGK